MRSHLNILITIVMFISSVLLCHISWADDMDDDISNYTDDSISSEDKLGKADSNINFLILDAISASQNGDKETTNFNDGSGDQNENSIVVGPGTQTGDIINVIIGE